MSRFLRTAVAAAFCVVAASSSASAFDGGRYGEVKVAVPAGPPRGYVVLFSDAGGWTPNDDARLDAIARVGSLVIGVDTDAYLARAARQDPRCLQLLGDAEGLSRQLQRQHPGSEYFFPILAGVGKGGALAGAILAQAPSRTIGGAVSLDPESVVLGAPRDFCPRVATRQDVGERHVFGVPDLKDFWTVALSPSTSSALRSHFLTLAELVPEMNVRTLEASPDSGTIASLVAPHLTADDFASVAGLPLVELPAKPRSRLMAVFFSGDGGWRDIDRTIAENLQTMGVSVVGWDSLRYFWSRKTPEQTAADLSAVITAYSAKWSADKVALIGFSFGADVLPFLYNQLSPEKRDQVALITLLSASRAADWEIRVAGWLGAGPSTDATPLPPAITRISGKKIQCFYGDQDKNAYCADLGKSGAEVIEKRGLHHFDGDNILIAHQILEAFDRRASNKS
jgi:type IV secretory pathway VirJ component